MLKIREMREAAGMSQPRLAAAAGIALRTLTYAESGRDVRLSTALAIARALGIPLSELLNEEAA